MSNQISFWNKGQLIRLNVRKKPRQRSNREVKTILFDENAVMPCHYCSVSLTFTQATIDHKRPVSKKGKTRTSNCVIACRMCNERKGSKSYAQFLFEIGRIK